MLTRLFVGGFLGLLASYTSAGLNLVFSRRRVARLRIFIRWGLHALRCSESEQNFLVAVASFNTLFHILHEKYCNNIFPFHLASCRSFF
jgi:hypothetical protein